jgi:5-phospho-D-xylono-1,4-lactonase
MSFIRTLTGDIAPTDLGVTYAHDHLYCVPPLWNDTDLLLDDVEATIKDVELFKATSGQAV